MAFPFTTPRGIGSLALAFAALGACKGGTAGGPGDDAGTNRAPLVTTPTPQTALSDETLTLTIDASDPDGDALRFEAADLPEGASLDATSGAFSWLPGADAGGRHEIMITVTDDGAPAESTTVTLVVDVSVVLVRFRVSERAESAAFGMNSDDDAALFDLAPEIAYAAIEYDGGDGGDTSAGTYRPSLNAMIGQTITLHLTPAADTTVTLGSLRATYAAQFDNNPSAIEVLWSVDSFAAALGTIQLDQARAADTALSVQIDSDLYVRWRGSNAFGDFGGGAAGFVDDVLILAP